MEIIPILEAIETILKADIATKDIIGKYWYFLCPPGVRQLPLCVLSVAQPNDTTERALGSQKVDMTYFTNMVVSVKILGRAYAYGDKYLNEMNTLDVIQDKICTVLTKRENTTLDNIVSQQAVQYVRTLAVVQDEYCGFEIGLIVEAQS